MNSLITCSTVRETTLIFFLFLIPGFPKDYLCYIPGLGNISTVAFVVIGGLGRLFGTILLSYGGDFIRPEQYGRLMVLIGIAAMVGWIAMANREKLDSLFREWHQETVQNG